MKSALFGLLLCLISQGASANLERVLDCKPTVEGQSIVKHLVVEKNNDGHLAIWIQSAWDDRLVQVPILKTLSAGDGYNKLVLKDDQGSTASLLMLQSDRIERAALIYEGPASPQPKGFGAAIDFLDCN